MPDIEAELVDGAGNPSLGVGECTVGPTAAAIGNAVAHALGVRIHDMPLTRDRIMAALLKTLRSHLTLRSGSQGRVSKGGLHHDMLPSFETPRYARLLRMR